jgi:hypothetical protein
MGEAGLRLRQATGHAMPPDCVCERCLRTVPMSIRACRNRSKTGWQCPPRGTLGLFWPHQESVRQHAQLVRALKRRNEEEVAAIIRDHVLGSIKYLPQREALP